MRLILPMCAAAFALWSATASAEPQRMGKGGDFGAGLSLGDPTGLSLKWFIRPRHAFDFNMGFAPAHYGAGRLSVTYAWHSKPWRKSDEMVMFGYLGVGVGMGFWVNRFIGPNTPDNFQAIAFIPRAPVLGLAFHFRKLPIDIFLEGAYSPIVGPPISFWNFDIALGFRYYFKPLRAAQKPKQVEPSEPAGPEGD